VIQNRRREAPRQNQACPGGTPTTLSVALPAATQRGDILDDRFGAQTIAELFGYGRGFGLPSDGLRGSASPDDSVSTHAGSTDVAHS